MFGVNFFGAVIQQVGLCQRLRLRGGHGIALPGHIRRRRFCLRSLSVLPPPFFAHSPQLRFPKLSGPVLRDTARLSQRYPPIARYGVFGVSTWPIGCDTPLPLF